MERRTFLITLAGGALLTAGGASAQSAAPMPRRWDAEAERSFRLGPGVGRQLMTEAEWKEHQQKMRTMSPEERERYRAEVHEKMVARAREKGITLPETPGPRGRGPGGPGAGPGGPGPGPGPGAGPGGPGPKGR